MDPLSLIAFLPASPPSPCETPHELEFCVSTSMDERVWSRLSQELLERILAATPAPSILRLRSVCKGWNSLFASQKFIELWLQHFKSHRPCFLMTAFVVRDSVGFSFYNPALNLWHQMLMPKFVWGEGQNVNNLTSSIPGLVASDGGLLLLGVGALQMPHAYVVCNPMTSTWKLLPRMVQATGRQSFIRMGTDSKRYKIIMACNESDASDSTTKVYDSSTDCWMVYDSALPPTITAMDYQQSGVVCSGYLYLVAKDPAMVVAFDLEHGVWSEIQPRIPDRIIRPHLVERHGQLMIVGGVDNIWTHSRWPNPQSIGVWKLDQSLQAWVEVARLPKVLCEEFQKWINFENFRCVGQHDILYLTCTSGRDVLAYDISKKTCKWLPESPRLVDHHGRPWWMLLPYEPSLTPSI